MMDYKVVGVMSGTSMDGLDIACCSFSKKDSWSWQIDHAATVAYPEMWINRLIQACSETGEALAKTNIEYGRFIGENVESYLKKVSFSPSFIASHGHTVFHQPGRRLTLQIGDGNAIAAQTNLPVIFDFRSLDVALGGQGAPLVPVGDRLLFGEYPFCLNLGGIANISFEHRNERIAYDICPANMLLNFLAGKLDMAYDRHGETAARGRVDNVLLTSLNSLAYYKVKGAKTLGREWFETQILPMVENSLLSPVDLLCTATEHVAMQIAESVRPMPGKQILVTGGGALNKYLVSRIAVLSEVEVVIPDEMLVNYKEALVFAFLGVLRAREEVNCLASVTGAKRDSCTGLMVK